MSNIIGYGISDTLKALFQQLRETPGISEYKYHAKDVDKVAQYLVCRNYGKACLELSYLCWAVVNNPQFTPSPLLNFFWVEENITPKRFRQAFAKPVTLANGGVFMGKDVLHLQIDDSEFAISPTRVSVLAVLLECIATIDPTQLTYIEAQLSQANEKVIKKLASHLQALIYQYLKHHIPEAKTQERFKVVSDWLKNQGKDAYGLNDQHILEFWQVTAHTEGYIKYSTALYDVLDTLDAMEVVEVNSKHETALSLGTDSDGGEVNPDWVHQSVFEQSEQEQDLSWLCQSPKFLTKGQWQKIEPFINQPKYTKRFPLAFLRIGVFSQWQSVLVQAKRKSQSVVDEKLNQPPVDGYQKLNNELVEVKQSTQSTQTAIGSIFFVLKSALCVGVMLRRLPSDLQNSLKNWLSEQDVEALDANQFAFNLLQQWLLQNPGARQWLAEAEKTFKANNKEGFKHLPLSEDLDVYQQGFEGVAYCEDVLSSFILTISQLDSKDNQLTEIFLSDLSIFKGIYQQTYGGTHD